MSEKICKSCKILMPLDHEHFGRATNGKAWQPHCRACGRKRSVEHRAKRVDEIARYEATRRHSDQRPVFSEQKKYLLWFQQNGICHCCAKPILINEFKLASIDHKNPVSKGGGHEDSNLGLAHRRCNTDKHNKTLEQHWRWRLNAQYDDIEITERILALAINAASCPS